MDILIAEDDLVSRKLLQATLKKWGYNVFAFPDGQAAWEHMQNNEAPRLIILDWMMPGLDGLELCRKIRALDSEVYRYIILLTARTQREDVVAGLDAGADDYITKPFDKQELKVRLRAGRRITDLQSQLLSAQEKLRALAIHDPLTGLLNRRAIADNLINEISRAKRHKRPMSVMMLDLDHFKVVNDTYGHMAGDIVLRDCADRITDSLRNYDIVGRYGGEEFLLILPDCSQKQGEELGNRIRLALSDTPMNTSEGMISISASIGVVTFSGEGEVEIDELIASSDAALYRAKEKGRNRVEISEHAFK